VQAVNQDPLAIQDLPGKQVPRELQEVRVKEVRLGRAERPVPPEQRDFKGSLGTLDQQGLPAPWEPWGPLDSEETPDLWDPRVCRGLGVQTERRALRGRQDSVVRLGSRELTGSLDCQALRVRPGTWATRDRWAMRAHGGPRARQDPRARRER
jgi:hypothetical protein